MLCTAVASLVEHGLCGAWAAVVAAPRFQSTGSITAAWVWLPCSIWDLSAGLNPRSPKLAGRSLPLSYEEVLPSSLKMLMAEQSLREAVYRGHQNPPCPRVPIFYYGLVVSGIPPSLHLLACSLVEISRPGLWLQDSDSSIYDQAFSTGQVNGCSELDQTGAETGKSLTP